MSKTLESALSPRATENSIGAIRLFCAIFVVLGHAFTFGGFGIDPIQLVTHNQITLGRIPVDIFFALSGYLISASFDKSLSLKEFLWHRFIRIYPAFWFCIILTSLIVPVTLHVNVDLSYLLHNIPLITGVSQSIAGAFLDNPVPSTVNSSLWTLPWELRAYLLVVLLGYFNKKTRAYISVFLALAFWAWFCLILYKNNSPDNVSAIIHPSRLLMFYMTGACFYSFRSVIRIDSTIAALFSILLLISTWLGTIIQLPAGGFFYATAPIPFTYLVFFLAKSPILGSINSRWDFSYGIYIWGAITLQILAATSHPTSLLTYTITSLTLTILAGIISWYLIEKPCLSFKNLFTTATK